jgi:hypothetical protein
MQETDAEVDLDDPTKPFTHSQIGKMLNEAERAPVEREYAVDLSYFFVFGETGTPAGMIGSHANHGGPVATGVCGDVPRVKPQPPRVPARAPRAAPSLEDELYPWGPAPSELGGELPVPNLASSAVQDVAPLPWALPNASAPPVATPGLLAQATTQRGEALEEDLRGAGLRNRAGLFVVGATLLAGALGALVWWLTLPAPEPPPDRGPPEEIAMVVTHYGEDEELDADAEQLAGSETGEASPKVQGKVELGGPKTVIQVPRSKTPHCENQRDRANQAKLDGKWDQLDDLSRETKCWSPRSEAKLLRMEALFQRDRLDECMKIATSSNHPEFLKWRKLCTLGRG